MPRDRDGLMSNNNKGRAMNRLFTEARLKRENRAFFGTPGVSHGNSGYGFIPAFCDSITGRVEISRFQNGKPATIHMIEGLPASWVVERDASSKVIAVRHSIVAGFVTLVAVSPLIPGSV